MPAPPLLLPTACAAAAAAAPASAAFPRLRSSRVRAPHLVFAFARLRKYSRRDREPVVTTSFEDDDDGGDDEEEEEEDDEVEEDAVLEKRPKPVGFGAGKTYSTDIEERLLREMGRGGPAPAIAKRRVSASSAKETTADLSNDGVHVRLWNLPKKKNIDKDLKLAFKGFPGLITINPAVSANKKTRDPICKGFAYLKLESVESATRFIELYSGKTVSFGKVQKPIKCCVVDRDSSIDPSIQASNRQAICQPGLNPQNLVAAN